ncbi:adhesin [Moraxella catarrhalis]|uniref:YadA-like family protein n=1 Tax=Moraxella catarrhalis TaxID=480 RepID=UPI0004E82F70|nr:YadA-like family protein [Moraxella catarrhalis]AIK01505.1 coiled stalk of trimeric autotransporter adhesin family protein [Moraxella catarrhalis]AVL50882.1 adhesin [Moraxella catarrhalis]
MIGATLSGSAYAQQSIKQISFGTGSDGNATTKGEASLAIGSLAEANGNQAIAIGSLKPNKNTSGNQNVGSRAKGHESIAIGGDVLAEGPASIAIGSDDLYLKEDPTKNILNPTVKGLIQQHIVLKTLIDQYRPTHAEGHASTAVGAMAHAQGHFSNAFGTRATATGHFSLAVGLTALAKERYTVAIGSNAQANQFAATAIGKDTKVDLNRGVALGTGSQILPKDNDANRNVQAYAPDESQQIDMQYQATQASGGHTDIFSIGNSSSNSSIRRKIINVGAGVNKTDAVNVAQLEAVVEWAKKRKITFMGDDNSTDVKLDTTLNIKGGETEASKLTDNNNIGVVASGNTLNIKLAKDLTGLNNITATGKITVGNGTNTTARLQSGGLTFTQSDTGGTGSGEMVFYGVNGVRFTNNANAGTAIPNTTRITRDKIGFAVANGEVDTNKPYLDNEKLKVGNSTLNSGGLTVKNTNNTNNEQIQVGADGIKFADVNNGNTGTPKVDTTLITKNGVGFNNGSGGMKDTLPSLTKEKLKVGKVEITNNGINAGGKEITKVKSAIDEPSDFVTRLTIVQKSKSDYAATIKDLHELSKVPLTFKGDTDTAVTRKLGQTLTIKGGETEASKLTDNNNIGVVASGNTLNIKLAKDLTGLNNITATGKITVGNGTNTTARLQSGGLTFTQSDTGGTGSGEMVFYGVNGVRFTNNANAGTAIPNTTRITRDKIGFAVANGEVDTNKPYLDNEKLKVGTVEIKDSGINAGDQEITKVKSAITKETTNGQNKDINEDNAFVKGLENAATDKQNSAATVKDLYDLSQSPLTFAGDSGNVKRKLGQTLTIKGGQTNTNALTENNIGVVAGTNGLTVKLAKTLTELKAVNTHDLTATGEITVSNSTANTAKLLSGGLTVKNANNKQIQVGADGIKFADANGGASAPATAGTTRITEGKIGFAKAGGTLDESKPYLDKEKLKVGKIEIKDSGINAGGKAITGLSSTLPNTTDTVPGVHTALHGRTISDDNKTRAASIADVLNAGFNLEGNGEAVDFVSTYDTVNFINGNATTAKVTYDNKTSKVAYDVNVDGTTIHLTGTNGNKNQIGVKTTTLTTTSAKGNTPINFNVKPGDDDALVKASDIKDNLNTLAGEIRTAKGTASTALQTFSITDEHGNHFTVGNPYSSYDTSKTFETVTFAGENGITISNDKTKGKVKVGIDQTKGLTTPKLTVGNNNGKGIVIDSKDGQNTITGLSNTLANVTNDGAGHALSQGLANDTDKTRAASIGDVLNAGFNLQGNGEAKDFVSTYDTVNFANGNATTAKVTYDDTKQTSTVTYDVNVDGTTLEVTGDKKLGVKTTTLTKTSANGNATKFSAADGDALVKASDIATHLSTLAGDIQTAKGASQASSSASYVDADGNKVIYDSTDKKYYQVNEKGQVDKTKEVAKDKLVAQAQTPDGTLAQMNVKSVINKEQVNDANKKQGINEDNAFVKGLEKAASDNKTKNAAVTVGDLNAVAQTPLTFAGDTGTTAKKLGETLTIKGGQTDTNKLTDNNIGVVAGTDGFTVKLAKDLTNLNSVNAGGTRIDEKGISFVDANGQAKANTPVLSANGLNMGGKRISNIGAAVDDNDAVNFKQFNEVAKTVNNLNNQSNSGASLPFVVTDANGKPINGTDGKPQKAIKGADGKYYHANANGVPVDKDGNPITDADKLANLAAHGKPLDAGHQVVASLGGNSDAITLTNIKSTLPQIATPNTGNNTNAGQAQSLPSLSAAQQSNAASVKDVLNVGFNLQTNHNQVDFVKAYDTVNFVNGTGADITSVRSADGTMSNITVNTALAATDDDGNVLIKAKDGKFYKADDLMPNGSLKAGKSASDAKTPTGLSLVNPNAGKGSTGDAVALNNLSKAVFKSKDGTTTTTVSSDGISIQGKDNSSITLSKDGLNVGGKVISNVGKGTKDTDAANVQQLNEVRNLLGLGNAGNDNADGNQVNIADIKKDPNSGSSSNRTVIKAGTVLGGKGNNDTEKLATGGVQVGVDKDGNANGDLSNVWVKTQKDGSKKALLATYNAAGQTNYLTNNPAEAIDRINEQGIRFFHVNDGNQEPVVQGRNGIDSSASGKHSVAVGYKAKADGEAAVAIGRQTQAGNQSIAIGDNAQATGDQSIAIGTGNVVAGKHSGAIGDPSTVKADNSYSVGNNNQFTDATQTDVFGVGNNITVTESNSVALGSNSAISAGTHAGTQAKKSDGTAGTTTTAGATGTVKGFAGQTAVGAVSVGASGAERRIQNVAAGEVSATSTDAVNGSQLYKATQSIANATNELDHRIHQNENKANAGISSAMAMASMPQAYIPGRSMVTGGIATHNGQGAVAVGLSKLSDNGQWVFKINGSADTQGHVGAAVGAGFHF